MKRLILTMATAALVAGPMLATATEASAQQRWDRRDDRRDDRWDRRDDRRDDRRWDRRDDRRDDRRGDNRGWDGRRYNGYYYNGRWAYGPPPQSYYGNPYYRPGYAAWRRGAYLPGYYRGRGYVVYDYGRYRLRPPPRGYYWYRVGNDYLLAAIATGLIYEVIANNY